MAEPRPRDEQPPREDGGPRGEELLAPGPPPASPPQALSMNELQQITDDISKLTIVHAIVLNSDFKLLENRVKETLQKAAWDSLEEQLSAAPPDYSRAIQLLQETKEALLSLLLPRHNRLRSQVEETLDMGLIRQEAEREALDIHGLTTYILGTMARLCAPIQDEEVRGLQSLSGEIFWVLGLMKKDMLNFTIQSLCTHLQDHTVQYEWKKFQELLDRLPKQQIHSFLSLFISPDGHNSQDFPKGLHPIHEELLEVGRRFGSVIHHNRQGFGPYYSGILKKVLLPDAEPDSDAGMDSF